MVAPNNSRAPLSPVLPNPLIITFVFVNVAVIPVANVPLLFIVIVLVADRLPRAWVPVLVEEADNMPPLTVTFPVYDEVPLVMFQVLVPSFTIPSLKLLVSVNVPENVPVPVEPVDKVRLALAVNVGDPDHDNVLPFVESVAPDTPTVKFLLVTPVARRVPPLKVKLLAVEAEAPSGPLIPPFPRVPVRSVPPFIFTTPV